MGLLDKLIKKKTYEGENIFLEERYRTDKITSYDGVPTVYYDIYRKDNVKVGTIELRFSIEGDMYYYGHVGYNILRQYRGNHYAYEACEVLFKIASTEFKMNELLVTCSPENTASLKTLKKLNGEMIDFVHVPEEHPLYIMGETTKYVFRYKIS